MPHVTVFTATYNRASKLHRVFNSLINQTFKDFEWLIIDDGSTDNTVAIIEGFRKKEPSFTIRYFYQPNSGKHIAMNKGVQSASGKWFYVADSDDEIIPEGFSIFINAWNNIPEEKKNSFCGIVACCKNQFGERISDPVPRKIFDGRLRELFYKYGFKREFIHFYKTEILKQYPFPEDLKNIYYPEGIVWRKMTDKYLVRVIEDEVRIYYVDEGENSLMSGSKKNYYSKAFSNCIESSEVVNNDLKYFFYNPFYFLKMGMVYRTFEHFLNVGQKHLVNLKFSAALFSLPFVIPGWVYFKILKMKNHPAVNASEKT